MAPSDIQPATTDDGGTTTDTATAERAGANGSAAAPTAREGQEVRLEFVGYDDEEKDVDEESQEAALLGGHPGKEQLGLSVFGFFKLVSGCVTPNGSGEGGLVALVV